jgi:hypothetical protein
MKKVIVIFAALFIGAISVMGQVSQGDVQLVQKYFGVEKASLLKQYMGFTPSQDSAFWPIYNKYESERLLIGQRRIALVQEYMNAISNLDDTKATSMVDKGIAIETDFKKLQKKYYHEMAKKIGPVKAAQFYQFENYINNVINLGIQENIPFVGDLEQKHSSSAKKK